METVTRLVRHGEVDNPDDLVYADLGGFSLSRHGRDQAAWAARQLAGSPIRTVYSSPLERARQTGRIIAAPHGLEPTVLPEVSEWALLSRWAGTPWKDLDLSFPGELHQYLDDPQNLPFSSESLGQLARRMTGAINRLGNRHPGEEIVVVSHQDPIQAALLYVTGQDLAGLHHRKPQHCELITLHRSSQGLTVSRSAPPPDPADLRAALGS